MKLDIRSATIEEVLKVNVQIPEFDGSITASKLSTKLIDKVHLILVASHDEKTIAYKIGYEVSDTEFYSWLGGVIPKYRKKGVATKLREKQESWALNHGYSTISVKSMNRYRAMLQMLISYGYHISGYEDNGCIASSKIKFIKCLKKIPK